MTWTSLRIVCCRLAALLILACASQSSIAASALRGVTEEMPPFNMTQNGEVTGMATEVVQAVLHQAALEAPLRSMPWARAYDLAQHNSNVLIYSIVRTPQREPLFHWVGVIAPTRWALFSLARQPIELRSLEDARRYQVATVKEDAGEQFLLAHQFALGVSLQSNTRYELNYEKLKQGHVDLWIANELNARYIVREAGDNPDDLITEALHLPELGGGDGMYLAVSLGTPLATVERLRRALSTVRANGTYADIARKWL